MLTIYFDGACEPVNPGGIGTFGAVIYSGERRVGAVCGVAGSGRDMTNNVAEYTALAKGLRWLIDTGGVYAKDTLLIRGDSKLVMHQLTGSWRCNHEHLRKLREHCLDLLEQLRCEWQAEWVPRDQNAEADSLSMQAWIKETGKPFPERKRK